MPLSNKINKLMKIKVDSQFSQIVYFQRFQTYLAATNNRTKEFKRNQNRIKIKETQISKDQGINVHAVNILLLHTYAFRLSNGIVLIIKDRKLQGPLV